MKFSIKKSDIKEVLARIQTLTSRKTNLAITETVLIKSGENSIVLAATDTETAFEGLYPAVVEEPGTIAINSKKFYEIIRDYPTEEIMVNAIENRWIEIGNKTVEYHIVGLNPEDYPESINTENVNFFDMDADSLKAMIERTNFVVGSGDDKRPHILGSYFQAIHNEDMWVIRLVSTDSHRLCLMDYPYTEQKELSLESGILIPKKGLNEVSKFLTSAGKVQVGIYQNRFFVKKDSETIAIRLLEGDFPKYQDIITEGEVSTLRVKRDAFFMMLKRMSILSSDSYKAVIFNFQPEKLSVNATNPEIGESKEEMPIEYGGTPREIAFNPKYFIDALNVIDDEYVVLHLRDEKKPCIMQGENDKLFLSVIMPMRI